MQKNVFIVIAAYNEGKKIGKVISGLKKEGYSEIVVVDDGSTDSTFEICEKEKIFALRHIMNRGQGAALKTGIDYALQKGAEIIITFDADGQFLVKEIKEMITPIKEGKADITLGSRFLGKAINIPLLKKAVLKLGIIVVFMLYGIRVTDSQCGFRGISRSAAEKIELKSDRMEHAAEIFLEIMRNNLKYREIPITVIYDDYSLKKGQDWTRSIGLGIKMLIQKITR